MRRAGRLVIAADGLHSVLARRAGGPRLAPEGHYTVGAHFEIPAAGAPRLDLHLGPGWYAGAAFHGDGTANIIVAVPRMIFRKAGGSVPALFAAACEQLPLLHASLDGARRSTPFISTGPLGCTRRAAVDDGLLFVGDAAGTINPMTGEGIATALRGAELAAATAERALRRGEASHKALAPYERARAEAFRDRWLVNRLLEKVIRRPVLTSFLLARLAEDPGLATTLLGVVGDVRPARDLISPGFLARLALFGA
jgi:flavin-dependent dehydrogenase